MTGAVDTIVVLAKEPRAGSTKTRLCPPCSPREAALVARAALTDTVLTVVATPATRLVIALDGDIGDWLPPGLEVVAQRGRGLDERIANAFEDVGPALLMGMDTPQVTPSHLTSARARLMQDGCDAVLGRTFDGGYWIVGLNRPDKATFLNVPMSCADTADEQLRRFKSLAIRCQELQRLRDVDYIDDAVTVARSIPHSYFARTVAAVCALIDERVA